MSGTPPQGPRSDDRLSLRSPAAPSVAGAPSTPAEAPRPPTRPSGATHADKAEFTVFYRATAPKLVAFLRWQGASLPDAAECAQEALTRCFQRWTTIENHHAWCRLVASRIYIRRVASIEVPVDDIAGASPCPLLRDDARIDELEHRHTILRLIDQLPLRQRQVLAWTYDGAPDAEIAEALHISSDAVRANRHKARAGLRKLTPQEGTSR